MTPQTIGRYQILDELGRGGMAVVYRARDPRIGREVAIKVLPRELLHDAEFRARFRREVAAVVALEHPAIVPVYEAGEHEGQPFMVMRYMSGGTLAARIMRGPMPLAQVARIIGPLAAGLDAAHAAGLVHRDVKPENVLFDREGQPYLADFGIVALSEATTKLTRSGVIGTPDYMAPELARPGGLTPLVDVYALGVLLFQMLTGRLPYTADTPLGTLVAHVTEPVPDVRRLRPDLPPAAHEVLARALAKDPVDRHRWAGELADDIAALAAGESPPTLRLAGAEATWAASAPDGSEPTFRPAGVEMPWALPVPERREPTFRPAGVEVPAPEHREMPALPLLIGSILAVAIGTIFVLAMLGRGGAQGDGQAGASAVNLEVTLTALGIPPTPTVTPNAPVTPPLGSTDPSRIKFTALPRPIHMLAQHVVDAGYSEMLNRIITLTRDPPRLVIAQMPGGQETVIDLPRSGNVLAISDRGVYAAVGHDGLVTYYELESGKPLKAIPVPFNVSGIAVTNDGRIFVASERPEDRGVWVFSVETGDAKNLGAEVPGPASLLISPDNFVLLGAGLGGTSRPLTYYKLDLNGDVLAVGTSSAEVDSCGKLWFTHYSQRAITGCGLMFSTQPNDQGDLPVFNKPFGTAKIAHVEHMQPINQLLVVVAGSGTKPGGGQVSQDRIYLYDADSLAYSSEIPLPPLESGGRELPVEARYVFANEAASLLYALAYVPALGDFGLVVLELNIDRSGTAVWAPPVVTAMVSPLTTGPMEGATVTPLDLGVVDAAYSAALDRVVLVAASPPRLVVLDPQAPRDAVTIDLPLAPTALVLSPDGLHAVVAAAEGVAYVDLRAGRMLKQWGLAVGEAGLLLTDDGTLYLFAPLADEWKLRSINAATGDERAGSMLPSHTGKRYRLHPGGRSLYGVTLTAPPGIERLSLVDGSLSYAYFFPYSNQYLIGDDLWLSADGRRIFTACGSVFRVTEARADDMTFSGSLDSIRSIRSLAHVVASGEVLVLPGARDGWYGCPLPADEYFDQLLVVFDDANLSLRRALELPPLVVHGQSYPVKGQFVFANRDGTRYYMIVQAKGGDALPSDTALIVLPRAAGPR